MKSKVLIIAFLIVSLLAAFTLTSKAQNRIVMGSDKVIPMDTTLIADETNLTYLKTGAKLVTYSEPIFTEVSLKFGDRFKSIHIYYKKDRHGSYKEYVIYLSTELANEIKGWAKSHL